MAGVLQRSEAALAASWMNENRNRGGQQSMGIRVLLADDHAIVRHGLGRAIQQESDMEVVGQAEDGHKTVDLARELTPDVVVMDISMPDLNGIEATREIRREAPDVKVIALSMHSAKRYVTSATSSWRTSCTVRRRSIPPPSPS
jgi:CheY-like chemotaxis protein